MLQQAKQSIDKALHHLENEFGKLQMGRANPALIEDIMIEQYGSMQPIKNSASIGILDPQTLSISPWDKELIGVITKAITAANIGLNPQAGAESILIKVPQMTEETRKDMVKVVKKYGEDAKVSIRNIRGDLHKQIGKQKTEKEISEDEAKDLEVDLQKIVDEANKKIEEATKHKEADVMKV
ncbi:ribosome recycling factor [Candidatus Gracilibacteria bacterium]|nr:ribosome recycling factor [Candidatus Gracilibacteria bacterium]